MSNDVKPWNFVPTKLNDFRVFLMLLKIHTAQKNLILLYEAYPCNMRSTATLVVEEMSSFHGVCCRDDISSVRENTSTRNSTITDSRKLFPAPNTPEYLGFRGHSTMNWFEVTRHKKNKLKLWIITVTIILFLINTAHVSLLLKLFFCISMHNSLCVNCLFNKQFKYFSSP